MERLTATEIRAVRQEMGLTQQQFAEYLGYKSWDAVSHWENGHRPVPMVVTKRIKDKPK